ncbi:MAG: alcohol dehydrogenase catalytic domain-containing protein [Sedimentisphaerales bacterium]|nr:alcohol dehydrogenase catalytic domain-containing protein [Sedimentisphaerales bacterium]
MKAARIFGSNDIRIVEVPTPVPGPGEVLCRVVCAGVCGTDHAIYTGEFSFVKNGSIKFPMTPGHEWSGTVAEIGPGVTRFEPDQRVVGDTMVSCGKCYDCLIGQYGNCKAMRAVGTIATWDGAYAEYILMPERHLFHLADEISFVNGAFVEPAATALYSVVLGDVKIGDTVLVLGSGPIGLLAAKLAKLCGASKVAVVGRKEFKLQKALELGVDAAIDTNQMPLEEAVKEVFKDWGVDCVIEASGSTALFKQAVGLVNQGGVVSVVAFYEQKVPDFDIDEFVFGGVKIRGVAGSLGMYKPVLRLMEAGMLDAGPLVTGRYGFDDIPAIMAGMSERNATRIKEIVEMKTASV